MSTARGSEAPGRGEDDVEAIVLGPGANGLS